jgi:hypothetical protein
MGSGPVVIADDGSPPPGLRGSGMKVGRQYEFMQQLENPTDCHTILGGAKVISEVWVNAAKQALSGTGKDIVEVTGNLGTKITVSSDGTAVKVCTTGVPLTEDLYKHWGRYTAGDQTIATVYVNNKMVSVGASFPHWTWLF